MEGWLHIYPFLKLLKVRKENLPPDVIGRPIILFLFCGLTNAEKTWLAKPLAAARIDMREYREAQFVKTDELFAVRHRVRGERTALRDDAKGSSLNVR